MNGPSGRLYVDDGGAGSVPVVFLHSAGGNADHWQAQLAHLRRERRALAIDLRGHGRSEAAPDARFAPADVASDVAAVVDALDLRRFVLAGHSQGGAVALAYAAASPDRVAGLFLLDPATDGRAVPAAQVQGLLAALRSPAGPQVAEEYFASLLVESTLEVRARVLADLRRTPMRVTAGELEGIFAFDPVSALARYPGPVFSLVTRHTDQPTSWHVLVPGLRHTRVEGVGHWLQLDDPARVNEEIDRFLGDVQ